MTPSVLRSASARKSKARTTNFNQGVFQTTNVPTDMGINGNGLFAVQDCGRNRLCHAQWRSSWKTVSGYIRTPDGNYLMGVMGATAPTSPSTGFPPDKIQIPATVTSGSPVVSFAVDSTGTITVTGQDGTTEIAGYHHPAKLQQSQWPDRSR